MGEGAKTALVLSAGGMFGAWQVGVWQALSPVFRPDIVTGTSVGALNAWAIAGGAPPEALIQEWLETDLSDVARFRLPPAPWRGVFDSRPLHARILRLWSSYRPLCAVGVVAAGLRPLRARLFRNEEIGPGHLAAACVVLGCYEPVRIEGKLYTDGGLLTALPLWAASAMGAETIVAVNALPVMPSAVLRAAVRGIRAVSRCRTEPAGCSRLVVIAPEGPLGSLREAMFWNRAAAERFIEQGRRDALRALGSGVLAALGESRLPASTSAALRPPGPGPPAQR